MLLLHDVDLLTQSTNALIMVFSSEVRYFRYSFPIHVHSPCLPRSSAQADGALPARLSPFLWDSVSPMQRGTNRSWCWEPEKLPSFFLPPPPPSEELWPQLVAPVYRYPHSNADGFACPGKAGGPHTWVRKRKYMSIRKGVNHSANANARKEGGQAQHPKYPIFRDKSGNLLANTGGGWIWMIPPSICP